MVVGGIYSSLVESLEYLSSGLQNEQNKHPIFQEKKNRITGKYQGLGAGSQQPKPAFLPICFILLLLIPVVGDNCLMGLLKVKYTSENPCTVCGLSGICLAPPQV